MSAQVLIALVIALGAAVRGNWSPCGESLQAQIHPLGERSRGNSWGVTISSFTIASIIAGGAVTSLLAAAGSVLGLAMTSALAITATLGIVAGGLDLSGLQPPTPRRQVNENWIGRYRGWVYGAAFGAQLGVGFSVFVMSWGYYAMLGAAFVSGSWVSGALIGAVFGLGRGILLLLAGFVNQPQQLARFHRRLMEARGPAFLAAGTAMVSAGILGLL